MSTRGRPKEPKLAVIETAEWWRNDQITSAKPLLQILCQTIKPTPRFAYSTFVNKESFQSTMDFYANKDGVKYIYISCHGETKHLFGVTGDKIASTIIKNRLTGEGIRPSGIYFGTCEFVDQAAVNILRAENCKVSWVAGYSGSPDWVSSASLDMLFWGKMLTPKPNIKDVVKNLREECAGLIEKLRFRVYFTSYGKIKELVSGDTVNLK